MEPLTIVALVLQTVVIVGAVFASFVRTVVAQFEKTCGPSQP